MPKEAFKETLNATMIHNTGMHKLPQVLKRIQRFYCMPMTIAGQCPGECIKCQLRLTETISSIDPKIAKAPYAVLVWCLRVLTSKIVEEASKNRSTGPVKNVFGENAEIDPLEIMLAGLGD